MSDRKSDMRLVQIQCVPVPNTIATQCNVFMYGLDSEGKVWFKRELDEHWVPDSRSFKHE